MRIWFAIIVILGSSVTANAADCGTMKADPHFKGLIQNLESARTTGLESLGFRLTDFPLIITHEKSPLCAAAYLKGTLEFLELPVAIELANGTYDNRDKLNPLSEKNEAMLAKWLSLPEFEKVLVFKFNSLAYDDYSPEKNTLRWHVSLAAHEGFHGMGQSSYFNMNQYEAGKPYISWTFDEGRDFVQGECYAPGIIPELSALFSAIGSARKTGGLAQAKLEAKRFLKLRDARYAKLKDVTFDAGYWKTPESCSQGEAVLEHAEGTADFVGMDYLLKLNLLKIEEVIGQNLETSTGYSDYYELGSAQLLLISLIDPNFKSFHEVIEKGGMPPQESIYTTRLRELTK